MSATSINKLVAAMFGDNFVGTVQVSLHKDRLKVSSGQTEMSVISNGVVYQLAEKDISVLKDGDYTIKVEDGYLCDLEKVAVKPAATKPAKVAVGGRSSAPPARKFD